MKKKIISITVAFCTIATVIYAQNAKRDEHTYFGIGVGYDYGGLGGKIEILPEKYLGLFAGAGYNRSFIGWNVGCSAKLFPNYRVTPTLCVFYGYNATIVGSRKISFPETNYESKYKVNMTSYGVTFGGGVDIKLGENGNKLSANLFIPMRSKEFSELFPIAFSIGYNFNISKR
ncbi:MAG: hypothetical protein LBT48_05875 [Prevotellaceae bacterium]|jgi:hypothetical protein|nr:hypothetical protein [Prevotellaceae bacterium]